MEKLRTWLNKQITRCEREIDRGGPFYILEAERDAYQKAMDYLDAHK